MNDKTTPAEQAVRELDRLRSLERTIDGWMRDYRLSRSLFAVQTISLKWGSWSWEAEERLPDAISSEFYSYLGERSRAIAEQIRAVEARLAALQELR